MSSLSSSLFWKDAVANGKDGCTIGCNGDDGGRLVGARAVVKIAGRLRGGSSGDDDWPCPSSSSAMVCNEGMEDKDEFRGRFPVACCRWCCVRLAAVLAVAAPVLLGTTMRRPRLPRRERDVWDLLLVVVD